MAGYLRLESVRFAGACSSTVAQAHLGEVRSSPGPKLALAATRDLERRCCSGAACIREMRGLRSDLACCCFAANRDGTKADLCGCWCLASVHALPAATITAGGHMQSRGQPEPASLAGEQPARQVIQRCRHTAHRLSI
jgi:hypothetical protein